jgi:octaprenyl-diphosphate synthase
MKDERAIAYVDLVSRARRVLGRRVEALATFMGGKVPVSQLMPGKMLRTKLAARLVSNGSLPVDLRTLERACAATEMVHTASLCHDDVIDKSIVRRGRPTLWRATTRSGAVLVGDLLLCDAMELLLDTDGGRYVGAFVKKLKEVCLAEAEQELALRGRQLDEQTCLRLARGKTGPLFAFVGQVCGGDDEELSAAIEEAGYRIGTAYQLGDDLLDVVGEERVAAKTLGTDQRRGKLTLPQLSAQGPVRTREQIDRLCRCSIDCVSGWPGVRTGIEEFWDCDLQPILDGYGISSDVRVRPGT